MSQIDPVWECSKCGASYTDPDILRQLLETDEYQILYPIEAKDHWLGLMEPVCTDCAAKSGIPSIDEE